MSARDGKQFGGNYAHLFTLTNRRAIWNSGEVPLALAPPAGFAALPDLNGASSMRSRAARPMPGRLAGGVENLVVGLLEALGNHEQRAGTHRGRAVVAAVATHFGDRDDRFEKRDGEWKIAYRICTRDWASMDERPDFDDLSTFTSTRALLLPQVREFMNAGFAPKRDASDVSYARPLVPDPARREAWDRLER